MKVFDKLIRVSKASILEKRFGVNVDKLTKKERKVIERYLPTEDEIDFMEIFQSPIPELARLKRKMSVCVDVEVTELEDEKVTFIFGSDKITLTEPQDAWKLCQALEKSTLDGVAAMFMQGCIQKNGKIVDDKASLKIDEVRVIELVASKFFFQIFLTSPTEDTRRQG